MSASRPYRDPGAVDPDPGPAPASDVDLLGPRLSVHAPPPLGRALVAPLLIAGVVLGVGVAVGGPLLVVSPFALAALALFTLPPLRLRGLSVALHDHGLVVSRAGGRRVVPFEEVNEVWFELDTLQGRAGASLRALRLVDHAGHVHPLPLGVTGAAALTGAVLRACSVPLLAEARRALREGETLTFGEVLLDRQGITARGARLSWPEIRLVVVQRGRVHLHRRFPILAWRTVRLDRIPHPTVFVGLVVACAARVRVDDPILVPFATGAEQAAALKAQLAQGGRELALRHMLAGGVCFLVGALITWASYSSAGGGTYFLMFGPMIAGVVWFAQGLRAYLSGR